jgi:hypothetical protein
MKRSVKSEKKENVVVRHNGRRPCIRLVMRFSGFFFNSEQLDSPEAHKLCHYCSLIVLNEPPRL